MQQIRFEPILLMTLLLWAIMFAVSGLSLPPLPIDETRYLTVAWEMHLSQHWLLPTLNGEAYSHKPPLLFWLINLVWSVAGVHLWAARLVPGLVTAGVLLLTRRLSKILLPQEKLAAQLAPLLLLTCPAFLIYGGIIMFDLLLGCCALLALECVWRASQTKKIQTLGVVWRLCRHRCFGQGAGHRALCDRTGDFNAVA